MRYLNDEQMDFLYENYDCNVNDLYEYMEYDILEDRKQYNIGDFIHSLSQKEIYTILDDLGMSYSDLEDGYDSEILSNYINDGYIETIAKDNDIIWDKTIIAEMSHRNTINGLKIYKISENNYERIVECPQCGELRYIIGFNFRTDTYVCPACKNKYKSELTVNSKGERLVNDLLKRNKIDFDREVIEIENYRYDFIATHNEVKYYIEVQGLQHYEPVEYFGGDVGFLRTVKSDLAKKKHANQNGVYIELDYREHDVNILRDRFNQLFIEKYIKGE